jgi:TP901 family phage tail tape measure protein
MPVPVEVKLNPNTAKVDQALARIKAEARNVDFGSGVRSLNKLSQPLGRITGQASEFEKSLQASNARVLAFGASVAVINKLSQAFSSLLDNTIKVESVFAKINTILGGTTQEMEQFGRAIFKTARETGTSFDQVAEGALELARQGLSAEESISRIATALKLVRVTGIDAEKAVGGLTAAIKGFEGSGLTVAQIADKLSEADVNFAVSTKDLIEGLQRSAASARVAGVSFDELLASITVVQERTQRGGAVIGNAFKTIFSYIARPETINYLEQLGIQVVDSQGKLRDAIPIIRDLGVYLEKIGMQSETASMVIQKVAGVRQRDILVNLIEDLNSGQSQFNKSLKLTESSVGSLDAKQKVLNDTLEFFINKTVTAGQEFAAMLGKIGFTDAAKSILDSLSSAIEKVTDILDGDSIGSKFAQGLIRGIGGILTGPGLILIGAVFLKLFIDLSKFGLSSLQNLLGINKASQQQAQLQQSIFQTLASSETVQREILRLGNDKVAQALLLNKIYNEQILALQKIQGISASVAPILYGQGMRSGPSGVTKVKGTAAGGYIAKEQADISKGVGGAPSSAKVAVIPNFKFGSGQTGTMVANTSEYFVPNYSGGADAIFNQDMVRSAGIPLNARKINQGNQKVGTASSGYIPNFSKETFKVVGAPEGVEFSKAQLGNLANLTMGYAVVNKKTYYVEGTKRKGKLDHKLEISNVNAVREKLKLEAAQENQNPNVINLNTLLGKRMPAILTPTAGASHEIKQANLLGKIGKDSITGEEYEKLKKIKLAVTFPSFHIRAQEGGALSENLAKFEKDRMTEYALEEAVLLSKNISEQLGIERAVTPKDIEQDVQGFLSGISAGFGGIFDAALITTLKARASKGTDESKSNFDISLLESEKGVAGYLKNLFGEESVNGQRDLYENKINADSNASLKTLDKTLNSVLGSEIIDAAKKRVEGNEGTRNTKTRNAATGYIPNFSQDALQEAIARENASVPINQIRINQSGKLRNAQNPMGLAVTNTRDEPTGAIPNFTKSSKGGGGGSAKKIKLGLKSRMRDEAAAANLANSQNAAASKIQQSAQKMAQALEKTAQASNNVADATQKEKTQKEGLEKTTEVGIGKMFALSMVTNALSSALGNTENKFLKFGLEISNASVNFAFMRTAMTDALKSFSASMAKTAAEMAVKATTATGMQGMAMGAGSKILSGAATALPFVGNLLALGVTFGPLIKEMLKTKDAFADLSAQLKQIKTEDLLRGDERSVGTIVGGLRDFASLEAGRNRMVELIKKGAGGQEMSEKDALKFRLNEIDKFAAQNAEKFAGAIESIAGKKIIQETVLQQLTPEEQARVSFQAAASSDAMGGDIVNRVNYVTRTQEKLVDANIQDVPAIMQSLQTALKNPKFVQNMDAAIAEMNQRFSTSTGTLVEALNITADVIEKFSINIKEPVSLPTDYTPKIFAKQFAFNVETAYSNRMRDQSLKDLGLERTSTGFALKERSETIEGRGSPTVDGQEIVTYPPYGRKENIRIEQLKDELAYTSKTALQRALITQEIERQELASKNNQERMQKEAEILQEIINSAPSGRSVVDKQQAAAVEAMIRDGESFANIMAAVQAMISVDFVGGFGNVANAAGQIDTVIAKINGSLGEGLALTREEEQILLQRLKDADQQANAEEIILNFLIEGNKLGDEGYRRKIRELAALEEEGKKTEYLLKLDQRRAQEQLKPRTFSKSMGDYFASQNSGFEWLADNLGTRLPQTFENSMTTALDNIATGAYDSLWEVFGGVALDFGKALLSEMNKAIAADLTRTLFKEGGAGSLMSLLGGAVKSGAGYIAGLFGTKKAAGGGYISGGSGVKDDVPALLMGGEYVIKKSAVQKYGTGFFDQLNQGRIQGYASGGQVQGSQNVDDPFKFWSGDPKNQMIGGAASNARLERAKQTDFFMPGSRGAGAIVGKENLLAFATQERTSGATDTFTRRGRSGFSFDTELQSSNLSARGRMRMRETPQGQALSQAKQQAFDLFVRRVEEEQRVVDARKEAKDAAKKQLRASVKGAFISAGIGAASQYIGNKVEAAKKAKEAAANASTGLQLAGEFSSTVVSDLEAKNVRGLNTQTFQPRVPGGANGGSFDSVPMVPKFSNGGRANAMLMGGEYVVSPQAASSMGKSFLDDINNMRYPTTSFSNGGALGSVASKSGAATSGDKADIGEVNITINIENNGNGTVTAESSGTMQDQSQSKEFAKKVKDLVVKVIQEEKRVSGSLFTRNK